LEFANPQGGDVLGDRGFVPESPDFYKEILAAVIHEFQLDKHDDKILGKTGRSVLEAFGTRHD